MLSQCEIENIKHLHPLLFKVNIEYLMIDSYRAARESILLQFFHHYFIKLKFLSKRYWRKVGMCVEHIFVPQAGKRPF